MITSLHRDAATDLPARQGQAPARLSPVAWMPSREMELPEWIAAGRCLGAMFRCGQWGLGDWIRYGNTRFGERYTRAAQITGYDVQTLMNMVYVASRFDVSRRRENLSWSHHETLASLEPDKQDHWLDRAVAEKLSIADLRGELRSSRRGAKRSTAKDLAARPAVEAPTSPEKTVCPNCGAKVLGSERALGAGAGSGA